MELFFSPSQLVGLLVLFVSVVIYFAFNKKPHNLPPGRSGLPLIGETLELFRQKGGNPEKFVFDRISKYSSDVFRSSLLGSPTIFFCGSDGNKFLFSNEYKFVQMWAPSYLSKVFGSTTQVGLRALLHSYLKPEVIYTYIGVMDQITQAHFASNWEKKDQVTVFTLTQPYTFQLACRLLLSVEDANRVAKLEDLFGVVKAGLSIPVNLPGTPFNRAIKASKAIRKEFVDIIKQRKIDLAQGKALPTQDILSVMLKGFSDEEGKFLDDDDLACKIFGLIYTSYDTLSSFCATLVKYLGEFPEVYQGVYNEQMEIANSKAESGDLLQWNDINKMKYSWNVAREVMRHAPLAHGGFREAIKDFVYKGFSIPKGYKIYWSLQSTHKNPECFPEPFKFDPSRFDGSGPAPYTFVPFGGGPRICPGKDYSRLQILVFMHHLVKRFKWVKVIPDEGFVLYAVSRPEKGLPVYLHPHAKS